MQFVLQINSRKMVGHAIGIGCLAVLICCLVALSGVTLSGGPALAASGSSGDQMVSSSPTGSMSTSSTDTGSYRLGPGDVVRILVWGHDDLTVEMTVLPDGTISYPLIDSIKASGLTVMELKAALTTALSEYIKDPKVYIAIPRPRTINVQIIGEVKVPGTYGLDVNQSRVIDAYSKAGGATVDGDITDATVKKARTGEVISINIEEILSNPGHENNILLEDGDVLNIPKAAKAVIMGEVTRPGAYNIEKNSRLMDVISLAGDFTNFADLESIRIYKKGDLSDVTTVPVGKDGLLFEGGLTDNPAVGDGDLIFVPKNLIKVQVVGPVKQEGTYDILKTSKVLDLISLAGGLLPQADGTTVSIRREIGGKVQMLPVNVDKLYVDPNSDQNYPLMDGDIIYIPQAIRVRVSGEVKIQGTYSLKNGSRVLDAILAAGGALPTADTEAVTLLRSIGESGSMTLQVNLQDLMNGRNAQDNHILQDGDIINVPEGSRQAFILGEVKNPGAYPIKSDTRLVDVITMAGGQTEKASLDKIAIYKGGNITDPSQVSMGTNNLLFEGSILSNPKINAGDVINVPKNTIKIKIAGEVKVPGEFEIRNGSRVIDAIAQAGGVSQSGDRKNIVISRPALNDDGTVNPDKALTYTVNLDVILAATGSSADNMVLKDGDTLFVPQATKEVRVAGLVKNQGIYELSKDARAIDAIIAAGGALERADLNKVEIYNEGNPQAKMVVSLGKGSALYSSKTGDNPMISEGDVIYVPEVRSIDWQKIFAFLAGLQVVKSLFFSN